jgi:hypothetical protein
MSNYSWCFTWSDLDKNHKLKLISDKFLEKYPYLVKKDVCIGDSFTIIKMGGQEDSPHGNSTWAHIKHNHLGLEMLIDRDDSQFFYHKYGQ